MDAEVAKAINDLSKRMTEMEFKLEKFLLSKHEENKNNITDVDGAISDLAEIVSEISSSITTEE